MQRSNSARHNEAKQKAAIKLSKYLLDLLDEQFTVMDAMSIWSVTRQDARARIALCKKHGMCIRVEDVHGRIATYKRLRHGQVDA